MAQRATGSASAKLTPSRYETWVEDVVEHYRLRAGDLLRFLRTKFGNYDERYFNIRVSAAHGKICRLQVVPS